MKAISKLIVSLMFVLSSNAHAIVVDGDLNDWIGAPGKSANDWAPINTGIKSTPDDDNNSGYLDPGWGGQAYDAEAIYATQDALNFYVAVVTGLSPDTTQYPAGDLAFDFGNDGTFEYGVVVKTDGQASGATNGGIGSQGEVYKVSQWNVGLWDVNGNESRLTGLPADPAHPTTVKSGDKLPGLALIVYKEARYNGNSLIDKLGVYDGKHYLIEAKISKNFFNANDLVKPFTVHWTMGCANDSISADPLPSNVPTSPILPMLALGLTLLTGFRRNPNQNTSKIGF